MGHASHIDGLMGCSLGSSAVHSFKSGKILKLIGEFGDAATVHACAAGVTEAPVWPHLEGSHEHLLSLELEWGHGSPPVLLGVEVLVGPMKEAWSSVLLRHLEGLSGGTWS